MVLTNPSALINLSLHNTKDGYSEFLKMDSSVDSSAPTISAAPGSSPKHAIYAFIIYSQICAIFVMWKEWK